MQPCFQRTARESRLQLVARAVAPGLVGCFVLSCWAQLLPSPRCPALLFVIFCLARATLGSFALLCCALLRAAEQGSEKCCAAVAAYQVCYPTHPNRLSLTPPITPQVAHGQQVGTLVAPTPATPDPSTAPTAPTPATAEAMAVGARAASR